MTRRPDRHVLQRVRVRRDLMLAMQLPRETPGERDKGAAAAVASGLGLDYTVTLTRKNERRH